MAQSRSLWTVDDEATNVLMHSLYTHLSQGMGKGEALQAAQAETRMRYPHPYYWAGFVLTGDPGESSLRPPATAIAGATGASTLLVVVALAIGVARRLIARRAGYRIPNAA